MTDDDTPTDESSSGDDASPNEETDPFLEPTDVPDLRLDDIAGLEAQKSAVQNTLFRSLESPELGQLATVSALFYGEEGCGMRRFARAVAGELGDRGFQYDEVRTLRRTTGSDLEAVTDLIDEARERAPMVLLLDCFDESNHEGTVTEFQQELRELRSADERVVVLGVMREHSVYDELNTRYVSSFGLCEEIDMPESDRRCAILRHSLSSADSQPFLDAEVGDQEVERLAGATEGFGAHDLRKLVRRATQQTLGETTAKPDNRTSVSGDQAGEREPPASTLTFTDLKKTIDRVDEERAENVLARSAVRDVSVADASFDDIGGLSTAKERLRQLLEYPLEYADEYDEYDVSTGHNVLLYGPPGNGKTMLAEAVASETDRTFLAVTGPELTNVLGSGTERRLHAIFEKARRSAPSVVFFDEFDSVATARGTAEVGTDVVNTLLTELDGVGQNEDVVVIAATNRVQTLDPALLRPGRFEYLIPVKNPDRAARAEVFDLHMDAPTTPAVTPDWFAKLADELSGAAIASICETAIISAIKQAHTADSCEEVVVTRDDVSTALEEYRDSRNLRQSRTDRMYC